MKLVHQPGHRTNGRGRGCAGEGVQLVQEGTTPPRREPHRPSRRCGRTVAVDPAVFRRALRASACHASEGIKNGRQPEPTACDGIVPENNRALGFLAFDAVELVEAPEPGPTPLAEDVLLDRAEGTQRRGLGTMTADVVLDPTGIPALLSESLDVPRDEAVRGADFLERLRSGFARLGTGWSLRQLAGSLPRL
jgi:hypothetical protein